MPAAARMMKVRNLSWAILNISVLLFCGRRSRIFVEERRDEEIRMM
jgi:hypothetical protein